MGVYLLQMRYKLNNATTFVPINANKMQNYQMKSPRILYFLVLFPRLPPAQTVESSHLSNEKKPEKNSIFLFTVGILTKS